jgi:tripartite-type tricarboxylate transporter receptor subunit TctC
VENRVGGGGIVGTVHVQQSEPNGYTLLLTTEATFETLPLIKRNVGYDPDRDFELLSIMNETPWIICAAPRLGATTLADLVRIGRADPNGLHYSSSGVGTGAHIVGEVFSMATGIPMTGVHFNGSMPALTALLGGQVPVSFQVPSNLPDFLKTGQVRAVAVTAPQRFEAFPDIPTAAEQGFPQLDVSYWVGFAVSRRTPDAVRDRLRAAIRKISDDAGFQADMRRIGIAIAPPRTPEETAQLLARNRQRLAVLVRERGITLD